jgi:putative membrane protein
LEENERNSWFKVLIVLLLVVLGFAFFVNFLGFGMTNVGMMGGMMRFGWGFLLLPVILIIVLIYALLDRNSVSYYEGENPMQVLERRYANGEISRNEYLKIKEDLNRNNPKEMRWKK